MFKGGKGGILTVDISDENLLYQHYMSFVDGGGLFVPTKKTYELGDDIFFPFKYLFTARAHPHDRQGSVGDTQGFWEL